MKHSMDPFEAALLDEEEEFLPDDVGLQTPVNLSTTSTPMSFVSETTILTSEGDKNEDREERKEDLDLFTICSSEASRDEKAKTAPNLSQFTEEQMARYEAFRRSRFSHTMMARLISMITEVNISWRSPVIIVVAAMAKMLVGDLVETGRKVMTERNESGPIRPCHIREAYRRLQLEGKVPRRSVPRLFR